MKKVILIIVVLMLYACHTTHEQYLDFEGFTVERGVYKPKPGWNFIAQDDGTFVVARDNNPNGTTISPCGCEEIDAVTGAGGGQPLPPGGSCDQASTEDDNGNILSVWCVNNECSGWCTGGASVLTDGGRQVISFNLESAKAKK
jgi:hypothetical protein